MIWPYGWKLSKKQQEIKKYIVVNAGHSSSEQKVRHENRRQLLDLTPSVDITILLGNDCNILNY